MNMPEVVKRPLSGKIMAGIGVLTLLSEVILRIAAYIRKDDTFELDHWVLAIGALIGFVGFYVLDSKKTKEATEVITGMVKFGRRRTDAVAVPETLTVSIPQRVTDEMKTPPKDSVG